MTALEKFAPGDAPTKRALRQRLYDSRDICGSRAARSSGWTYGVFKAAEEIAAEYVWRPASEDELLTVANAILRIIQAGVEIERLEVGSA